jgi:hypothetical protein
VGVTNPSKVLLGKYGDFRLAIFQGKKRKAEFTRFRP